jgi:hypothetical protein
LTVEGVKILPLDGYKAMLNIKLLGQEGVPLYVIVFGSITEKKK